MEIRKVSEDITVFRFAFQVSWINAFMKQYSTDNNLIRAGLGSAVRDNKSDVIHSFRIFSDNYFFYYKKRKTLYSGVYFVLVTAGLQDCEATCASPINQ